MERDVGISQRFICVKEEEITYTWIEEAGYNSDKSTASGSIV